MKQCTLLFTTKKKRGQIRDPNKERVTERQTPFLCYKYNSLPPPFSQAQIPHLLFIYSKPSSHPQPQETPKGKKILKNENLNCHLCNNSSNKIFIGIIAASTSHGCSAAALAMALSGAIPLRRPGSDAGSYCLCSVDPGLLLLEAF